MQRKGGNPYAYNPVVSPTVVRANPPVTRSTTRKPCESLPMGCGTPSKKTTAAKKPTTKTTTTKPPTKPPTTAQILQVELQESQKALKELQLTLDAEKSARQKSEAARKDCEEARSKCESKSQSSAPFNLNTRSDLAHTRQTTGVQFGGKKAVEEMLKQERSACGFRKQLSSSCKECIYSVLKDRDENSCRKELRKLLKKMNSCQMKRIDRSTTIDLLTL
tara:strand:+ start:1092 stop:1751 length:660 start_codon:yes stop_codon:yes gene_type:complete